MFSRCPVLLLLLLFCRPCFAAAQSPVTHLQDFRPGNGRIITLEGPWAFYRNRLLEPGDFKDSLPPTALLLKPGAWNDLVINGQACGGHGYATYRLVLDHLPPQPLMLGLYSLQTSCRVYVNGVCMAETGRPGTTAQNTVPASRDIQLMLPQDTSGIELVIQVANFHHRKGGFVLLPEIGAPADIMYRHLLFYVLDATESSALAIMGLFLLALFIFRRKDISVLYFALFCITLSFRPVISVNYLLATLWPGISWPLMLKLEYAGVIFPCLFMTLFMRKRFPRQLPLWIVRALVIVFSCMALVTLVFPPVVFSWLVLPILVLVPAGIVLLTITIVRAVLAREDGANFAGMGVIVLFISLALKVLSYAGLIPTMHVLITVLDIGFIFMMSLILGSRFSVQFAKVEALQQKTENQHREIQRQKEMVDEKNREILDSINYAKRIQYALLAHDSLLQQNLPQHFVLFRPKDIVSGDFYWAVKKTDEQDEQLPTGASHHFYLAVCDSTGHGVPGAFMSLLNISFLNEAITEKNIHEPGAVFNHVRQRLITHVSQEGQQDGMDGILLRLQPTAHGMQVQYAAANNAPLLVRRGQALPLACDKMPIGRGEVDAPFVTNSIDVQTGDMLYLLTDGYADQFGGPRGKKFKHAQLQQLLVEISALPVAEQKNRLEQCFNAWKGDLEQVDDVCIIGIKL